MLREIEALNYVAGRWCPSLSGETYEKRSPSDPAAVTGRFALSGAEDARAAVEAAHDAFPDWAALPMAARAAHLDAAAAALDRRAASVAEDMADEMGKPVREGRVEVERAVQTLRVAASEATRPVGENYEQAASGALVSTLRRPVGVVALITPWNFPCAIPVWKLAPALIYGNTVVLKLAYDAPRTGLHVAQAFAEAGLPAGVLNVLTGRGGSVGAALVEDPSICALSFTGSIQTGHRVRDDATRVGKRVQLELGGHNPLVVMADAALERATEAAYAGAFWSAGQKCTATRRIYVQDAVYEEFERMFLARVARAKIGDPRDSEVEVGPLVNADQLDHVLAAIERGRCEGGTLLAGGERPPGKGYFISPTVFGGVQDGAYLSCEEVFGPVVSLYRFATLDEAITRGNGVEFGLSAAIFTSDLGSAIRFQSKIQAGVIHINSQTAAADNHVPFGGLKNSGFGPHERGRTAREFYTDVVTTYVDSP
jgi:alpha-ketoglutaric semialdehyde dehydrogenase